MIRTPRKPQWMRNAGIRWEAYREEREFKPGFFERLADWWSPDVFGWVLVYSVLSLLLGGVFWPSQTLAVLGWAWYLLGLVFGLFRWIWGLFGGGDETEPVVQTAATGMDPRLILTLAVAAALILWVNRSWLLGFVRTNTVVLGIGAGVVAIIVLSIQRFGLTGSLVAAACIAGIGLTVGLLKRLGG